MFLKIGHIFFLKPFTARVWVMLCIFYFFVCKWNYSCNIQIKALKRFFLTVLFVWYFSWTLISTVLGSPRDENSRQVAARFYFCVCSFPCKTPPLEPTKLFYSFFSKTGKSVSWGYPNTEKCVEKTRCSGVFFNQLEDVWIPDETFFWMFDIDY